MLLIHVAKSSDCPLGLRHELNSIVGGLVPRAEVEVELRLGLPFILAITFAVLLAVEAATRTKTSNSSHIASPTYAGVWASACAVLPITVTGSLPIPILVFGHVRKVFYQLTY